MKTALLIGSLALGGLVAVSPAHACGGFFCGRQPVDQTAERILFEVGEDSVTMTTQISFNGAAPDFAWILPLSEVPAPDSLAVFPQRALTGLDSNSGPDFLLPQDCQNYRGVLLGGVPSIANESEDGGVIVHIRAEVGDYSVAVIESDDPDALVEWLRNEEYRVTSAMEPYIDLYTEEGMKFLALKLLETADVNDIKPFRFTLPGTTPSIPLRMTALAAEPEMSILVFVLGQQRYEAKNWENLAIDDSRIRFDPYTWPLRTNWTGLVAQAVDGANGKGWVTEFAGATQPYAEQIQSQIDSGNFATEEDEEAATALLAVLGAHPYMTRLYTRLSAEEMTVDPVFGKSANGDVSRQRQLSRVVNGVDQCSDDTPVSTNPCDFATCGAGGVCREVTQAGDSGDESTVAACGCVPGATARTTFAPDGSATVICQDQRLSFLNPGDKSAGMETLPDPCADFDCGRGSCVPVNMTPTCECDEGFVATGSVDVVSGERRTRCVAPNVAIPTSFYDRRLPTLPAGLPGGRDVEVPDPDPASSEARSGGGCSVATGSPGRDSLALLLFGAALHLARRRRATRHFTR